MKKLTEAQLAVLEKFVGELVDDGHFHGNDMDLEETLTSIVEEEIDNGRVTRAYEIARVTSGHLGAMSFDEFRRHYAAGENSSDK